MHHIAKYIYKGIDRERIEKNFIFVLYRSRNIIIEAYVKEKKIILIVIHLLKYKL
jgi:hypothetical protein